MIHEAGSIIISITDGEAKPERSHTHTHLDTSPGSPAPESVLLIPTLESPPLKTNHKVKMKIQGIEKNKTVMNTTLKEVIYKRTSKQM